MGVAARLVGWTRARRGVEQTRSSAGTRAPGADDGVDAYVKTIKKGLRRGPLQRALPLATAFQNAIEHGRDWSLNPKVPFRPEVWLSAMAQVFAGRAEMARVVGLDLHTQHHLSGAQLGVLVGLAPNLRSLDLQGLHLEVDEFRTLVMEGLRKVPKLESLNLSYSGLTVEKVQVLAEAPHLNSLVDLDVAGNGALGDAGIEVVATATTLRGLTALDITNAFPYPECLEGQRNGFWGPGMAALRGRDVAIRNLFCDCRLAEASHRRRLPA